MQPHFFILNKGRNSGKPLQQECRNCFVFIADTPEECQHFFSLCYALWQGKCFHILLIGSVIEFIRIDEFSKLVYEAHLKLTGKMEEYANLLKQIHDLNLHHENLRKQFKLVQEIKLAVIYKLFK